MLLLPTTSKLLVGDYQVGNANLAGASPDASIARGSLNFRMERDVIHTVWIGPTQLSKILKS